MSLVYDSSRPVQRPTRVWRKLSSLLLGEFFTALYYDLLTDDQRY